MIKKQITRILGKSVRALVEDEKINFEHLQEIRLRVGQPVVILYKNKEWLLPTQTNEKKRPPRKR